MSKRTIGEFMALLRKANGYTQQDIAEKLNISDKTLSSWETNRTLPDVLMLPVIAEIYGVTVDELINGERNQSNEKESADYSDKAKRNLRQNRFCKFSTKCSLLSGLTFIFEGFLILAGLLYIFTYTPPWVEIFLAVAGLIGITVCVVLVFYYAGEVKFSEGLVSDKELSDEDKAFALAVKRKCGVITARLSLPLLIFAMLTAFVFMINMVLDNYLDYYIFIIVVNIILGVIPLTCYIIYNCTGFKKLANEKQLEKFNYNKKLLTKLCIFGLIPILVFGILAIALYQPIHTVKNIYKNDNFDEFKNYMQTVVITEDSTLHTMNGAPLGEYTLNFPDDAELDVMYDLGDNFYGSLEEIIISYDIVKEYRWYVVYDYHDDDEFYSVRECTQYKFRGENLEEKVVVNARFPNYSLQYDYFALNLKLYNDTYYQICQIGNSYAFTAEKNLNLKPPALALFILSICASAVTCTTIYFVKRKRQEFSF